MKKVNTIGKLNLAKETVAKLNNLDLNGIKGGDISNACETNYTCRYKPTSPIICTN
jgi:hypothetical protein